VQQLLKKLDELLPTQPPGHSRAAQLRQIKAVRQSRPRLAHALPVMRERQQNQQPKGEQTMIQPKSRTSLLVSSVAAVLLVTFAAASFAAEKSIEGEAKCAKCALKETKECQTVIQAKEGNKTVTYYLVDNDVSKKFHDNVCKTTAKVRATGDVKEVNGKMQFTATKIELVKD
jgi:hypothetical protein